MSARDEIRDPWGWLVAAVCGGLAWAVLAGQMGVAAVLMGLLIGSVVLGTKVAVGAIRDRGQEPRALERPRDRLPAGAARAASRPACWLAPTRPWTSSRTSWVVPRTRGSPVRSAAS